MPDLPPPNLKMSKPKKRVVGITINEPTIKIVEDDDTNQFHSTIKQLDFFISRVPITLDATCKEE